MKSSSQRKVNNTSEVPAQNNPLGLISRIAHRLAHFRARSAKEARREGSPFSSQRVELIRHCMRRGFITRLPGDGKTKQEQQPLPNLAVSPIERVGLCAHAPVHRRQSGLVSVPDPVPARSKKARSIGAPKNRKVISDSFATSNLRRHDKHLRREASAFHHRRGKLISHGLLRCIYMEFLYRLTRIPLENICHP